MFDTYFTSPSVWFTVPAAVGTIFFAIRLFMALTGIDGLADGDGGDMDGGFDAGVDADAMDLGTDVDEGMDHAESTSVFRFVSIQTVTAFAMGFGWGGLVGLHSLNLDIAPAFAVAIVFGFGFAWFIVWLFKLMYAMESSGNITINDTLGCEGVTSSTIPAHNAGTGRVRLTIGDRQRAYGARSEGEEIHMGAQVRVVRANQDNTVTVTRA